jgi:hypothetical protein
MDIISPASSLPARLYSFFLTLRPLQPGSLMAFNGELVHAAWLEWMRTADPEIASWLHEGSKRRLFTCSSLLFPYPSTRMRDAERRNVHIPLTPEQAYQVRVTLLHGELFPLFHHALTTITGNTDETASTSKTPFMQLGKQQFALEGVVVNASDDPTGWTGWTSLADLVTQARAIRMGRAFPFTGRFFRKVAREMNICHPERSEGSLVGNAQILRYAQDDRFFQRVSKNLPVKGGHSPSPLDSNRSPLLTAAALKTPLTTAISPAYRSRTSSFLRWLNAGRS